MVGNIYGLPFENKFVDEPAPESRFPFGYTKNIDKLQKYNGAFSDDDTDVEYIYLLLMEKYGVEPTYANMREGWVYHIRDRVWLANRAALGLVIGRPVSQAIRGRYLPLSYMVQCTLTLFSARISAN